jgi:DNA polymerase III epsilon subunit-like protein
MRKLIFLDTETTGLSNPRLLQLGWAINNHPVNVQLYKPPVPVEAGASEIHHITQEQADMYEPFDTVRESIQKLLGDGIVIAHNLPFDRRVLANEGVNIDKGIDTLTIARRLYPGFKNHKLGYLIEQLGIPVDMKNAHNAFTDVTALRELFKRMVMSILCKDPEKSSIINRMVTYTP